MADLGARCGSALCRTVAIVALHASLATVAVADDGSAARAALEEAARALAAKGDIEAAVARYRESLALSPGDGATTLAMAMTLSWSKDRRHLEEAESLLSKCIERVPADGAPLLQRARVRSWLGETQRSVTDYRAYLAKHPSERSVSLELAAALSSSKERESQAEAIAIYDAHLRREPADLDVVLKRARVRSWAGQTAAALVDYRAYLAANAGAHEVELELARMLSWSARVEHRRAAIPLFERQLARRRDDESVVVELAKALSSIPGKANMLRAIRVCDAHLRRHPGAFEVVRVRGRVRAWAGMTAEAAEDLAAYAAAHPHDLGAALEHADVVSQGRDPSAAIPLYDAYLARRPGDEAARIRRAGALLWAGEYHVAERELDALRGHANHDERRNELDLQLARLYAQTERTAAALDLVEAVVDRAPDDQAALAERARLRAILGPRVEPRFFHYADEGRLFVSAFTVEARAPLARKLSLLADVGAWSLGVPAEELRAGRANLGALFRAGLVQVEGAAGPRLFERFGPDIGARAAVRVQPKRANLELSYQYDDLYIDTFQPASISAGIRGHAVHLGGDVELPPRVRLAGRVGSRVLNSDNRSFDAAGRAFVRVVEPLYVGYEGQYLTWRFHDASHWSPQAFAAHLGAVKAAQTLLQGRFAYEATALAGVAGERVEHVPEAGFGLSYGGSASVAYAPAPRFTVRLTGQYSSTIREAPLPSAAVALPDGSRAPSTYWWATASASVTVLL